MKDNPLIHLYDKQQQLMLAGMLQEATDIAATGSTSNEFAVLVDLLRRSTEVAKSLKLSVDVDNL